MKDISDLTKDKPDIITNKESRGKTCASKTKVINIYGGPGAGKSTTAAGLFHKMKMSGESVELVTEYAKDLVYDNSIDLLGNQMSVLGEQFGRMYRLDNKVEYIITDSPLILTYLYVSPPFTSSWFYGAVHGCSEHFENINFFLNRTKKYVNVGRTQSEEEAKKLDERIKGLLDGFAMFYYEFDGDENAVNSIYNCVIKNLTRE